MCINCTTERRRISFGLQRRTHSNHAHVWTARSACHRAISAHLASGPGPHKARILRRAGADALVDAREPDPPETTKAGSVASNNAVGTSSRPNPSSVRPNLVGATPLQTSGLASAPPCRPSVETSRSRPRERTQLLQPIGASLLVHSWQQQAEQRKEVASGVEAPEEVLQGVELVFLLLEVQGLEPKAQAVEALRLAGGQAWATSQVAAATELAAKVCGAATRRLQQWRRRGHLWRPCPPEPKPTAEMLSMVRQPEAGNGARRAPTTS